MINDEEEEEMINRYQRRRPRRQNDIEQLNLDLEEFRRLNLCVFTYTIQFL